ncbi:unnamed protein product [Paramecium pentaurelia]|uniref:HSF-type DNA-binding domain-containing protein n=1 Tax=Paramecium pentaurelia TaxID=43138 RepID=A0A8S1TSR4_9CILI|nr:unnamed protein product [Paramecium pentaurelia]
MSKPTKFISKLYEILESNEYRKYIRWQTSGDSFVIPKIEEFSQKVMVENFTTKCFQSFLRQLSMYGFSMKKNERNQKQYQHQYFVKGKFKDLYKIVRNQRVSTVLVDESNLNQIRQSNIELKMQLDRLKEQQGLLSYHLRIQSKKQELILLKLDDLLKKCQKKKNPEIYKPYKQTWDLMMNLLKGYQPQYGSILIEPLYEICEPMTPFSEIQNTPLQFPFI